MPTESFGDDLADYSKSLKLGLPGTRRRSNTFHLDCGELFGGWMGGVHRNKCSGVKTLLISHLAPSNPSLKGTVSNVGALTHHTCVCERERERSRGRKEGSFTTQYKKLGLPVFVSMCVRFLQVCGHQCSVMRSSSPLK